MTEPPTTDHARTCGECGASLDERQEICVDCGHAAGPRDRRRIRRALPTASLAAFAVLLAASAAYGLSAGGAGNVRDLGVAAAKPAPDTVASATPTLPPASGTTTPAAPVPPATPTPPPSSPPKAPKVTATKPKPTTTTPTTTTPSSNNSNSGTTSGTTHHHTSTTPTKTHHHHHAQPSTPSWFTDGDPPYDATVYDASGAGAKDHPSQAPRAIDGNTKTAWTSGDHAGGSGVGLVVDTGQAQPYTAIGIATSTPGFNVSVYSSNDNTGSGPPTANGWKLEGKKSGVAKFQKVGLKGNQPRYLLIWITKMPSGRSSAGISEIRLLL